jgi:hypothetical protein
MIPDDFKQAVKKASLMLFLAPHRYSHFEEYLAKLAANQNFFAGLHFIKNNKFYIQSIKNETPIKTEISGLMLQYLFCDYLSNKVELLDLFPPDTLMVDRNCVLKNKP